MIRHCLLLFLLLITHGNAVLAQVAPDFTVTDSWGHTHRLYQDYLDQDKTVVLKVFYVACPPCNAIAPHLEPLYQTWGGGNADVQFIELSILQSDSNVKVNGYKNNHNTTFPAAGGEGGSVSAVEPYKSGLFGMYTGTPTFVVIAPDGSVNYDVSGFNIPGTIEALDAAIAATGATGMITSSHDPFPGFPVRLLSNLVHDELSISVYGEASSLVMTIYNTLGVPVHAENLAVRKGDSVTLNIAMLPAGLWICQLHDLETAKTASHLFVKQ